MLTKLLRRVTELQERHPDHITGFVAEDFLKDLEAIKLSHLAIQDQIDELVQGDVDLAEAEEPERERDEEAFAKVRSAIRECQTLTDLWINSNDLRDELAAALDFPEVNSPLFRNSFTGLTSSCRDWFKVAARLINDHPVLERRYHDLKDKYSKLCKEVHSACRDPPSGPVAERPAPTRSNKLKLELPTFSGHPLDWRCFHELFATALDRAGDEFSEREKACFLLKAMQGEEAEQIVRSHSTSEAAYSNAMEALQARFGSAKKVFPHLVRKMTSSDQINMDQSGFTKFRQNFLLPRQSMEALGCTQISQMGAALALSCFDSSLRDEWTKYYKSSTSVPTLEDIEEFLKPLESNLQSGSEGASSITPHVGKSRPRSVKSNPMECPICREQHKLFKCPVFLGYNVDKRYKYIKDKRGCTNCLSFNHQSGQCASSYTCRECDSKHNTLLHRPKSAKPKNTTTTPETAANSLMAVADKKAPETMIRSGPSTVTFLHTAIVKAVQGDRETDIRLALDTGASTSFISEKVASQLRLKRQHRRVTVSKSGTSEVSNHYVKVTMRSILQPATIMEVYPQVVKHLPHLSAPREVEAIKAETHLQDLPLADPQFGGQLDLLLGGVDYADCITGALLKAPDSRYTAQPTIFGWTVSGPLEYVPERASMLQIKATEDPLKEELARLWELDRTPDFPNMSIEDDEVTQHFLDTHTRDEDGRYIVKLPRVPQVLPLGASRNQALRRAKQVHKTLQKKGGLSEFQAALEEYPLLNHAETVPDSELEATHYYMPVHGVFKASSTTTKVRPVFDASAPTSTGTSLNDTLRQGPNLYPQLTDILLKFRLHTIGFSADISKMFREIGLHPEERDYHRFLMENEFGQFKDLRMKRLTFGVRSSPYLATQVIRHLAEQHSNTHPEASKAILTAFYVDDYLAGAETVQQAVHIRQQLCGLLQLAGMTLRKWRSSSDAFRATIPKEIVESADLVISSTEKPIKALGLHWNVSEDKLSVSTPPIQSDSDVTKRCVASNLGKVYDLLGFYSPFMVSGKIILRRLWELKLGWDEIAPTSIQDSWKAWSSQLKLIANHSISRRYTDTKGIVVSRQLHGFSDASQEAYGAVVYLQETYTDQSSKTAVIMSKARVMPLKQLTIPRAELTAAYLLAKLLRYCAAQLDVKVMTAWTDSSIVLCWLRKSASSLKTFVGNRVTQIQNIIPNTKWRHISSSSNPADMLSRGIPADILLESDLWWKGPPWLNLPPSEWPPPQFTLPEVLPEMKTVMLTTVATPQERPWTSFSSFDHMTRILSWCRRFLNNLRSSPDHRNKTPTLSMSECQATINNLIRLDQQESFPEAFKAVKKKERLPRGHALYKFECSIDENGVLLINTRVRDPLNPSSGRKIIPLSIRSELTKLLLQSLHRRHLHPGTNTLLAIVKETYHIPGIKSYLKGLSRRCVSCQRAYQQGTTQPMGLLPQTRTTPSAPFLYTGVDFAGPFRTKQGYTRKPVHNKSYACIFVCMATRAVHIELCLSLSSDEFLAALRRFCSRRGCPTAIYSDNGTNFIGAHEELQRIQELLRQSKTALSHYTISNGITWHFSPPRTPHMGGLWEAAVKQMKLLLRKIVQPHQLRTDELSSILVEIEGMLNSRPLVPLDSTDPEILTLTPGHFLAGRPLKSIPMDVSSTVKLSTLKRWQLTQRLSSDLWAAWKTHYLQALHSRQKWNSSQHSFHKGDVVLLKEDSLGYRHWPLARIKDVFPGDDGVVRVVELQCEGRILKRSTHLVIPLIMDEPGDVPTTSSPPSMFRSARTEHGSHRVMNCMNFINYAITIFITNYN